MESPSTVGLRLLELQALGGGGGMRRGIRRNRDERGDKRGVDERGGSRWKRDERGGKRGGSRWKRDEVGEEVDE